MFTLLTCVDCLEIGITHLTTGMCGCLRWRKLISGKVESPDAITHQLLVFSGERSPDTHLVLVSCREIFVLRSDLFCRMWKSINQES